MILAKYGEKWGENERSVVIEYLEEITTKGRLTLSAPEETLRKERCDIVFAEDTPPIIVNYVSQTTSIAKDTVWTIPSEVGVGGRAGSQEMVSLISTIVKVDKKVLAPNINLQAFQKLKITIVSVPQLFKCAEAVIKSMKENDFEKFLKESTLSGPEFVSALFWWVETMPLYEYFALNFSVVSTVFRDLFIWEKTGFLHCAGFSAKGKGLSASFTIFTNQLDEIIDLCKKLSISRVVIWTGPLSGSLSSDCFESAVNALTYLQDTRNVRSTDNKGNSVLTSGWEASGAPSKQSLKTQKLLTAVLGSYDVCPDGYKVVVYVEKPVQIVDLYAQLEEYELAGEIYFYALSATKSQVGKAISDQIVDTLTADMLLVASIDRPMPAGSKEAPLLASIHQNYEFLWELPCKYKAVYQSGLDRSIYERNHTVYDFTVVGNDDPEVAGEVQVEEKWETMLRIYPMGSVHNSYVWVANFNMSFAYYERDFELTAPVGKIFDAIRIYSVDEVAPITTYKQMVGRMARDNAGRVISIFRTKRSYSKYFNLMRVSIDINVDYTSEVFELDYRSSGDSISTFAQKRVEDTDLTGAVLFDDVNYESRMLAQNDYGEKRGGGNSSVTTTTTTTGSETTVTSTVTMSGPVSVVDSRREQRRLKKEAANKKRTEWQVKERPPTPSSEEDEGGKLAVPAEEVLQSFT